MSDHDAEGDAINFDELVQILGSDEDKPEAAGGAPEEAIKPTVVSGTSASFKDFMLRPELMRSLQENAFEAPSIIQQEAIPQGIIGVDLLCQAQSGSGKTCVFVISVLQQITPVPGQVQCVCVAPIRELALQITTEFERFSRHIEGVSVACFTGGYPEAQNRNLLAAAPPTIVVGTPGRLASLAESGALPCQHMQFFIVDECDAVLSDDSKREDAFKVFEKTTPRKQVMMFSATLSAESLLLCRKWLRKPKEVFIDDPTKQLLSGIVQRYVALDEKAKNLKLEEIFENITFEQLVIFVSTRDRCERLQHLLVTNGFPAICTHSALAQEERERRCREFRDIKARILVATDLFHRGMDVPSVNFVINYDMPRDETTYLHRIGRAGRFSTYGLAISFVATDDDREVLAQVQKDFLTKIPALASWEGDLDAWRRAKKAEGAE